MGQTLNEIAQTLKDSSERVQLIYAFNGVGKTRLSREFKDLIESEESGQEEQENTGVKVLYYNAFTEDLFYWDNNGEPKIKIHPNNFTDWIIRERGQDQNIIGNFQRYTDDKLTPYFIGKGIQTEKNGKRFNKITYPEVAFSFDRGTERSGNVKISKGEESSFIWSIFYTLLEEIVEILNDSLEVRDDNFFDDLEYVFIDDPVSSLDDNHLIELAVDVARLVKSSPANLRFVITTHNPLFYNVLSNEFNNKLYKDPESKKPELIYRPKDASMYRLDKKSNGEFVLNELDKNTPFSYHLFLLSELKEAIISDQINKFHFSFIRNILEKTATFLGYTSWTKLLPKGTDGNPDPFANRILNLSSHSAHAGEETGEVVENDKVKLSELVDFLSTEYKFWKEAN